MREVELQQLWRCFFMVIVLVCGHGNTRCICMRHKMAVSNADMAGLSARCAMGCGRDVLKKNVDECSLK